MASAPLPRRLLGKLPTSFGPAFATIGSNATIQAVAFAGSVIVARRMGVQIRGEYAGATAWCALLSALSDCGVSQGMPYRCARHPMAPGKTLGSGLVFAAAMGTLGALFGLVASWLLARALPQNAALAQATAAFLPSIPLLLVSTYVAVSAQGLGLVKVFNAVRLAQSTATFVGVLGAALLHGRSGVVLTGAIVGAQAVATAFSLLLLHRHATARSWRFDREEMRHLWRFGIRTQFGNLAGVANTRLDQMIMSVALASGELGIYANAVSYAGLVFALASATTTSNLSHIAAEVTVAERSRRVREALRRNLRVSLGLGLGLALIGFPLLPLVFGVGFARSAPIAAILMAGGVLLGLNYTLSVGLRAGGHPLLSSVGEGIGLFVTAIGLPFAIFRLGITGAALVSVGSYAVTFATLMILTRRLSQRDALRETVAA